MISKISGKLTNIGEERITVSLSDNISYDIFIPRFLFKHLLGKIGQDIDFYTYHYLEGGIGGGTIIPRLVGFTTVEEREFFEKFITVPDIGVKKALRSFVIPTAEIASAIENAELKTLEKLPGIGKRSAQKIIAELKGKVAKYALMKMPVEVSAAAQPGLKEEVTDVLLQLGYTAKEAELMIEKALAANPSLDNAEDVLQAIYRQKSGNG